MRPDSFHQFSLLPFELRRIIYLLASPARFVHVREEHEDRDEFEERFRTTSVPIKLHPSIAYFARNWRERIPFPRRRWQWYDGWSQTTLERYGFSGPSPTPPQSWEPTAKVPGIPYEFLSENPDVAWEFMRSGSFYSTAPIPLMLHVTRESRQVLVDDGYELAFRTRTCGPRTWFNFKIDVLYLGIVQDMEHPNTHHDLLSGNISWDIGQFEPQDLRRVRRLALHSSSHIVCFNYEINTREVSSILELFTGVEELFLEEREVQWVKYELREYARPGDRQSLWSYMTVQEVDALFRLFNPVFVLNSTGPSNRVLKAYKEDNMGDGSKFFVDTARRFEESLASLRDEHVSRDSLAPWKIPKVRLVFILPLQSCRALFRRRWEVWNKHRAFKEEEARSKALEEARRSIDVPRRPIYENNEDLPRSPFSEEFQYDIEAFEQINGRDDYWHSGPTNEEYLRRHWLSSAIIAAPEME
ncbi:hypothetical protein F5Y12DRAFT_733417 [Xylaria sp. FL1777]|nr:hypothetical protein F5Y12DRAFT_733417 [Xylaria sp. FL1777]